ncbi:MAG: hypothetical protein V3575_05515, partial [Candidatus Absconditabacteria bacterium]
SYTCEDMKLLNLDPSETTLICESEGKLLLNEVKTNDAQVTINTEGFSNVGDTRQVSCTKPANAVFNTLEQLTQTYDGTNWFPSNVGVYSDAASTTECKFKCEDGYLNNGSGICEEDIPPVIPGVITHIRKNRISNLHRGTCILDDNGNSECWGVQENNISLTGYGISGGEAFGCIWGNPSNYGRCLGDTRTSDWNALFAYYDPEFDIAKISSGWGSNCLMTTAGKLICKGRNQNGQLGIGSTAGDNASKNPVIGFSTGAIEISVGYRHACAIRQGGSLRCWGYPYGSTPSEKSDIGESVKSIAAGRDFTCILTEGGGVKCWGVNESGQLGNGTYSSNNTPQDVIGLSSGVKMISAGDYHACAVLNNDTIKCWGIGEALGYGSYTKSNIPVDVIGVIGGIKEMHSGSKHTIILNDLGDIYGWGANYARYIQQSIPGYTFEGMYLTGQKVIIPSNISFNGLDF